MRTKLDALFRDFTQFGETEYLKATAIGQDRALPIHEFVQPAHFFHQIRAWANIQVVGIAQNNLRPDLFNLRRRHPFNRGLSADRHENRSLNIAMTCFKDTTTGRSGFFEQCEHSKELKTSKVERPTSNY